MSERLKSWITSIIGILMILGDGILLYASKVSVWEAILLAILGWVFLMAKDSILEGITLGLFKVKKV